MAIMMGKLYAALRKADVPDDDAIAAAEEAAAFDNRLASVERQIAELRAEFRGEMRLLRGMLGFLTALVVAILGLILRQTVAGH